ncbi:MAG: hypothetical protein ACPLPR_01260 [Bacillota bacterium]
MMARLPAEGYREPVQGGKDVWDELQEAEVAGRVLQFRVAGVESVDGGQALILDLGDPKVKGVVLPQEVGEVFRGTPVNLVGLDVVVKVKRCDREAGVMYFDRASAVKELREQTWADVRARAPRLLEIGKELAALQEEIRGSADPEKQKELAARAAALREEGMSLNYNRPGVVRWVLPRVVFCDAGGVPAVVPAGQLSYGEVTDARRVVVPGQVFRLRVVAADEEEGVLRASVKANLPDPWETVPVRYVKGGIYEAVVKREFPGSFMVEFEPGVVGFLRKFAYSKLAVGAKCLVVVTGVDVEDRAMMCRFVRLLSLRRVV